MQQNAFLTVAATNTHFVRLNAVIKIRRKRSQKKTVYCVSAARLLRIGFIGEHQELGFFRPYHVNPSCANVLGLGRNEGAHLGVTFPSKANCGESNALHALYVV